MEDQLEALVEVYRCTLELEANRVLAEVLEPAGLECFLRDRTSHSLPAPSSEAGAYFIAVAEPDAEAARAALREARGAGLLEPATGELIEA